MAEEIKREIWLLQKRRIPPIDIVAGSQIPIAFEMKDYTIPAGATVRVYARPWGRETTYVQDAAVTGNTVVFTPQDGFFREGWNSVQLEINGAKSPWRWMSTAVSGLATAAPALPQKPSALWLSGRRRRQLRREKAPNRRRKMQKRLRIVPQKSRKMPMSCCP